MSNGISQSALAIALAALANGNGGSGEAGFSPIITVKIDTEDTYILTITTKDGSFDTPNLKAQPIETSPYQYAQLCGYQGTEEQFQQAYLNVINLTNSSGVLIIDGGTVKD